MTISKKVQYGLRAMVFLARNYRNKKFFSIKAISEKEKIPFSFLEKIIEKLEKSKLVKAKKGVQGGYVLSKPLARINVRDIIFALEGKVQLVDCCFCNKYKRCASKNVWLKLEKAFDKTLKEITLKKLINL